MRILLAEDERSLSRAVIALLAKKTITPPMRLMMARRPWSTWRRETTTPSSWI